jgi:putative ABC transport system substrate-binding protein
MPQKPAGTRPELAALAPDVILAHGSSTVGPLLQVTRTVPIVFPVAADPVGGGFVDSLARPGGNVTGFMEFEYGQSGKWLELLKEMLPGMTRAAVLRDPGQGSATSQFAAIQAVAPSLKVEVTPIGLRDSAEIERIMAAFARAPNDALYVVSDPLMNIYRVRINTMAVGARLPTMHGFRELVETGGLMFYGPSFADLFRRAANCVVE